MFLLTCLFAATQSLTINTEESSDLDSYIKKVQEKSNTISHLEIKSQKCLKDTYNTQKEAKAPAALNTIPWRQLSALKILKLGSVGPAKRLAAKL